MSYMQTMNREVFHQGWLIKSPPTKRIFRARWRRRWFTLKQGEIPGQYCLEYYIDDTCRKLKGVIDLDQCEQVDCGLRLEHRKQKFQYMFDVKTPRRTFYLAAESELDMHGWVNCICQVCNLQDLTKQPVCDRQYYNVGSDAHHNEPHETAISAAASLRPTSDGQPLTVDDSVAGGATATGTDYQNDDFMVRTTEYTNRETMLCNDALGSPPAPPSPDVAGVPLDVRTDYYNFSAVAADLAGASQSHFERSQSMSVPSRHGAAAATAAGAATATCSPPVFAVAPPRPRSLADPQRTTARRIPDNLKLTNTMLLSSSSSSSTTTTATVAAAVQAADADLSPALSTASGPYIAISECFTGGSLPDRDDPTTPLNSLDPRFYDMPRSRQTIGLNLIDEPQPYSPKRSNVSTPARGLPVGMSGLATAMPSAAVATTPASKSGRSSPSDSESVFTDDEEWPPAGNGQQPTHKLQVHANHRPSGTEASDGGGGGGGANRTVGDVTAVLARSLRPSDSSVENDSMAYTYTQRFSKMPNGGGAAGTDAVTAAAATAVAKSVVEPWIEASAFGSAEALEADESEDAKEATAAAAATSLHQCQMSDTENASPAIGPKDMSSCVEENYDIPRSHQHPYYRLKALHSPGAVSTASGCVSGAAGGCGASLTSSTPNLLSDVAAGGAGRQRHFYTNAAPTSREGNVFRYDFVEQENAPLVNRGLKPKPVSTGGGVAVVAIGAAGESTSVHTPLKSSSARRNANGPNTPTQTPLMQQQHTVKPSLTSPPPSIDRKLKPPPPAIADATPQAAAAAAAVTSTGANAAASPGSSAATGATAYASQTLPRNYNHSAARHTFGHIRSNSTVLSLSTVAMTPVLQPMLDYLELDTSAGSGAVAGTAAGSGGGGGGGGGAVAASAAAAVVPATAKGARSKAGSTVSAVPSTTAAAALGAAATEESSIVYKSVDFIKTEAIKRTRQDRTKTSNGGD